MKKSILILLVGLFFNFHAIAITTDVQLVGVWRHKNFQQSADGQIVRTYESKDDSSVIFKTDGTWQMISPRNQSSGTFRYINNSTIETIILESNLPHQVGLSSTKKFKVDAKTLELITVTDEKAMQAYPKRPDGTRPKEMIVTSTFERVNGNNH